MNLTQAVFTSLLVDNPINWGADWAWGLPLIVVNVVVHVLGLGFIDRRVAHVSTGTITHRYPILGFALILGTTTLLVTLLHGMEMGIWAVAYRLLNAVRDEWPCLPMGELAFVGRRIVRFVAASGFVWPPVRMHRSPSLQRGRHLSALSLFAPCSVSTKRESSSYLIEPPAQSSRIY